MATVYYFLKRKLVNAGMQQQQAAKDFWIKVTLLKRSISGHKYKGGHKKDNKGEEAEDKPSTSS